MSWLRDLPITWFQHVSIHMIYSYDLLTWSWHITYKLHLDIKLLSIPTFVLSLPCHNYILVSHWSCLHYFYILVSSSLQHASSVYYRPQIDARRYARKITSRSTPIQILVVVAWEEYPRSLLMKTTGESYSKCWVGRLARRSISATLEDVNISFNYPPYYSMSKSDSRISLVMKPSVRKSSTDRPLNGPVGMDYRTVVDDPIG